MCCTPQCSCQLMLPCQVRKTSGSSTCHPSSPSLLSLPRCLCPSTALSAKRWVRGICSGCNVFSQAVLNATLGTNASRIGKAEQQWHSLSCCARLKHLFLRNNGKAQDETSQQMFSSCKLCWGGIEHDIARCRACLWQYKPCMCSTKERRPSQSLQPMSSWLEAMTKGWLRTGSTFRRSLSS